MADLIPGYPGIVPGKLLGVQVGNSFVSCETSCDFNCTVDMLPASAVTSGRWKEFIPGMRGWTVTVNANLLLATQAADVKTVMSAIETGELMGISFATRTGISPHMIISGFAYPQTVSISAPVTGLATSTITFQGNGPTTLDFEEFWLIINAMPANSDKPIYIDTTNW